MYGITKHKFLPTCQIVVSKEFWRFFDAVRGFYINSAPESNRLFGGNSGSVYSLAFLPCRRGNSGVAKTRIAGQRSRVRVEG